MDESTTMHRPNCFLGAIARAPRRSVIAVSKQQPMQFGLRSRGLPELLLLGACIEINEQRLNYKDIQALYASEQYPLEKRSFA